LHRLWKEQLVRRVRPRRGEAILDMAGGTGDVAFRLAARGARVTVADINPDMLEVGRERAKAAADRRPRLVGRECRGAELRRSRASTPTRSPSASGTSPMSKRRSPKRTGC
jgi:SAM-dependent methyltransferase